MASVNDTDITIQTFFMSDRLSLRSKEAMPECFITVPVSTVAYCISL